MVAICYSSKTGTCRRYAESLSGSLKVPCFDCSYHTDEKDIIFIGWLKGKQVVGLDKFNPDQLSSVCVVGLAPGTDIDAIIAKYSLSSPVFYLRGAINRNRLSFTDKLILSVVCAFMRLKGMDQMGMELYNVTKNGGSFYDEKYLLPVIKLYGR